MRHPERSTEDAKSKDPDQNCYANFSTLANFDILAFTSTNGVESFFKQLLASGNDIRILAGKKIASVGKITEKKLLEYGIRCDYVPEESEKLLRSLPDVSDADKKRIHMMYVRFAKKMANDYLYKVKDLNSAEDVLTYLKCLRECN